jgi:hypothetical protein
MWLLAAVALQGIVLLLFRGLGVGSGAVGCRGNPALMTMHRGLPPAVCHTLKHAWREFWLWQPGAVPFLVGMGGTVV